MTDASTRLDEIVTQLTRPFDDVREARDRYPLVLEALTLVDRGAHPGRWAWLQVLGGQLAALGVDLNDAPRAFAAAIAHYEQALTVYTPQTAPDECAMVHNGLAQIYAVPVHADPQAAAERRIHHLTSAAAMLDGRDPVRFASACLELAEALLEGDLRRAVAVAETGLDALPADTDPALRSALHARAGEGWGAAGDRERAIAHLETALDGAPPDVVPDVLFNLGAAYLDRPTGNRAENLDRSIAHLRAVLVRLDSQAQRGQWAAATLLLGKALVKRTGAFAEDVEEALQLFDATEATVRDTAAAAHALAAIDDARGDAYLAHPGGDRADNVELAIASFERARERYDTAQDSRGLNLTQFRLGTAYLERLRGDHADNLEAAIEQLTASLPGFDRETNRYEWAQVHNNLAAALRLRIRGDRAQNVERAIAHLEAALRVYTREETPADWALAHRNLAISRWDRIEGSRAANIELGIADAEQALEIFDAERYPARRGEAQDTLGILYWSRVRGERAENVELAIACFTEALALHERLGNRRQAAASRMNLALALQQRTGDDRVDSLEQAIDHLHAAAEVITRDADPVQWAGLQHNLASTYLDRLRGDRAANVEQAIAFARRALEMRTREALPQDWASTEDMLGNAFNQRLRGDRADNVEQAVAALHRALSVYTREADPVQWARTNTNLALSLLERARDRREAVEEAVACAEGALEVATREELPDEWARNHNILGLALGQGEQSLERLAEAARHYEHALEVRTRESSPLRWAEIQINLAGVRIGLGGAENALQAIDLLAGAAEVFTRESDVSHWADIQFQTGLAYEELANAPGRDAAVRDAAEHFAAALDVLPRETFAAGHLRTASALGDLHFARGEWAAAHAAYNDALAAARLLSESAYTEAGRNEILERTARAHSNDTLCLIEGGDPAAALGRLEQGKTRALAEALALRDADLGSLPGDEAEALRAGRREVRGLEAEMRTGPETPGRRGDAELGTLLEAARAILSATLREIRAARPDFMATGLDVPELLRAIPPSSVLVAFVVTTQGGAAFVVPAGVGAVEKRHVVRLPGVDLAWLRSLLVGERGWLNAYALARTSAVATRAWMSVIDATTAELWNALIAPVRARLEELAVEPGAQLVLCPQGALGLLPLHAAWREEGGHRRALIDDHPVSYAPSGYALAASRRRASEPARQGRRLLSVTNPTGDLHHAAEEGAAVARLFAADDALVLEGPRATESAVVAAAPERAFLHFACHGHYDWEDITASALRLAGGEPLTLADLLSDRVDLSASRLVTLSACETGMTDVSRSADEYVGLPAGFLQAGAPTVLSTLWAVNDLSAALLVERFHERHVRDGATAAEALRDAQIEVRDITYDQLLARLAAAPGGGDRSREASGVAAPALTDAPFASPYHWAAFTLTGV